MVSNKIIESIFDKVILKHNHISNEEIRVRVGGMSVEEKKEQLKDKLNPFEKRDYDYILQQLDDYSIFDEEDISPGMQEEIDEYTESLFKYDKRIVRGYDVDKYKDKVPNYDIGKFKEDAKANDEEVELPSLEQAQVDAQSKIDFDENEVIALSDYFGNEYKYINGELSPKYKDGFWDDLNGEQREHYATKNKDTRRNMDSAINKGEGLLQPTVLYHGVNDTNLVDIHTRVGEHINFDMYISSSFQKDVGAKGYSKRSGGVGLYCKFLAPTGTKGVCGNDKNVRLSSYVTEHEYLLGRKNGGTVVGIDYDTGEVLILIDD